MPRDRATDGDDNSPHSSNPESRYRKPSTTATGRKGEDLAVAYLTGCGFRIIERNWRGKWTRNEIDLIARDGNDLVFVEVKSARTDKFGDPSTWIDARKQAALARAASDYLTDCGETYSSIRFDAILITTSKKQNTPNIRHVRGAFTIDE